MHLEKIKLVGFKSFVDPTDVPFPSNLVAVLGPNGCGKSNIIDAVRWVMGESSAKQIRGASMTDVIFNGCETRKPAGMASVELHFDNSDGKIGGEFAGYNQLALKRVVNRDGTSHYYLNNTRCRRKDITDIFLGTGLGPRSYSIIGQGTISQLIEAKPEDFRGFLEEAAGISKYKERRRETELRIGHTRDNLDRLSDLREELGKQIDRLERQAQAAERYQVLRDQEHLLKAQLLVLRWQTIHSQLETQKTVITDQEIALEALIAKQRHTEVEMEQARESQVDAAEAYNQVQAKYYQLAAEIARIEESIAHNRQRRDQLEQDLRDTTRELTELETQQAEDAEQVSLLLSELEELKPAYDEAKLSEDSYSEVLMTVELSQNEWQSQWDLFNSTAAESAKQAHGEQTRIQHLEQSLRGIEQRISKLNDEKNAIDVSEFDGELEMAKTQLMEYEEQHDKSHETLSLILDESNQQRETNRQTRDNLNKAQHQLQTMRGRLASLEALQQAALGQKAGGIRDWLCSQSLENNQRLAQAVSVQTGWEIAAETALGDYLQAVCVTDLSSLSQTISELTEGKISLIDANFQSAGSASYSSLTTLRSKIESPIPALDALIAGIYVAEDLIEAHQMLSQLKSNESIITKQGIWLGTGWLRFVKDEDASAGILQREQELKQLVIDLENQASLVEQLDQSHEDGQDVLALLQDKREQEQQAQSDINRKISEVNALIRVKQGRLEQLNQRLGTIASELIDEQSRVEGQQSELHIARSAWQQAMEAMEQDSDRRMSLQSSKDALNSRLDNARQSLRQHQHKLQELHLSIKTKQTSVDTLRHSMQRTDTTISHLRTKKETLELAFQEVQSPAHDLSSQLEEKLTIHLELESQVQDAKRRVENIDELLRQNHQRRQSEEQETQRAQQVLEQLKMNCQGDKIRCANLEEQIAETTFQLDTLVADMPEVANQADWEEEIERVASRIQRLGPINLAAIDEFKTESERKAYLDQQNADLIEALEILENAIKKIDQETRHRFKETFDKVNSSFQILFPKLFGGGKAYLELTGEDLLDTGVTVIARPPGKRNASIHLLSGGEKALTAVALVFAIFQLNPSPFCMLDEVDAPLDDANVTRFCNLVKEMSKTVQFIFITHNKVTMELADYLSGVTMNEPGVSRIVSVNVDEAVSLAEG